jgi:hypothetical protein
MHTTRKPLTPFLAAGPGASTPRPVPLHAAPPAGAAAAGDTGSTPSHPHAPSAHAVRRHAAEDAIPARAD